MNTERAIGEYVRIDREQSDLLWKLKKPTPHERIPASGMSEQDYESCDALGSPIFPQTRFQTFPPEVQDQFGHMQSNFATGLLPSISRAWMSIDSDIYMWNFEQGQDLISCDGIANTVLTVNVMPPKEGIYRGRFHSILVVATTTDLLLFGMIFKHVNGAPCVADFKDFKDFRNANLEMNNAALITLPLNGMLVSDLCCTKDGRVFFSAEDSLYELQYYEPAWYGTSNCKAVNHSRSILSYLKSISAVFYNKDEIRQLAIDHTRHHLYALFNSGAIQIFDLGQDGKSIQKLDIMSREQIEHNATQNCNVTTEFFKEIVGISVIPSTQSLYLNLVAVTSKGVRILFSCLSESMIEARVNEHVLQQTRPQILRIVHIRFPPGDPFFHDRDMNIYSTLTSNECIFMASASGEYDTNLWSFSSAILPFHHYLREHMSLLPIRGNVWDIAKQSDPDLTEQRPFVTIQELDQPLIVKQVWKSSEKFFVLSSKGIYTFEHLSPLEVFRQILLKYGSESKQFKAFKDTVEKTEICVMALSIVCSTHVSDASLKDSALRIFYMYGGEPMHEGVEQRQAIFHSPITGCAPIPNSRTNLSLGTISGFKAPNHTSTPQDGFAIAQPSETVQTSFSRYAFPAEPNASGTNIIPSARHEALFIYFARIVSRIWERRVCYLRTNIFCSSFNAEEIQEITASVGALIEAFETYPLISPSPSHYSLINASRHIMNAREGNLVEQERQSLMKLRNGVLVVAEVLKLWEILLEHRFEVIIGLTTVELRQNLIRCDFEALVRNKETICTELITALVRFYIGDEASVHAMTKRLNDSCPSLFTRDDASVVKATDNLHKVLMMEPSRERSEMVAEAVGILQKSITKQDLVQPCDLLLQVNAFDGIVTLALTRAEKDDPKQLAIIAYKKQLSEEAINEALQKRNDAYACITDAMELLWLVSKGQTADLHTASMYSTVDNLKKLAPTAASKHWKDIAQMIFESDDELANVAVFRWLLAHDLQSIPIERRCRFFEAFLYHEIDEGKGNRYLELLWKYYEKSGNFSSAAKCLLNMGSKIGQGRTSITQRITYLSHALMCIQSAPQTKPNLEMKEQIQDYLDIAQVQLKTRSAIEARAGDFIETRQAAEAIEALTYRLFDLNGLYERFAMKFELEDIQDAIMKCAEQ